MQTEWNEKMKLFEGQHRNKQREIYVLPIFYFRRINQHNFFYPFSFGSEIIRLNVDFDEEFPFQQMRWNLNQFEFIFYFDTFFFRERYKILFYFIILIFRTFA